LGDECRKWLPNIIMHPARHKGIGSAKRCFGRVMMSVNASPAQRPSWRWTVIRSSLSQRSDLILAAFSDVTFI
jgi:hypothetical protein